MFIPTNFLGTKITKDLLNTIEYLVVGGGGGSTGIGGGGGAGGFISSSYNTSEVFGYTTSFDIFVGDGGSGTTNGQNSYISSSTIGISDISIGGGHGGRLSAIIEQRNGDNGGSGGGGTSQTGTGGSGTSGQGFGGGDTYYFNDGNDRIRPGGGGGASEPGQTACCNTSCPGKGGDGKQWIDGQYYAGGGGAVSNTFGLCTSQGGIGGGGNGSYSNNGDGTPNTGGGAGGNWTSDSKGGSGIVKIRYYGEPRGIGGTITQTGSYTYHEFTDTGSNTFEFPIYLPNELNTVSLNYEQNLFAICSSSNESIYYYTSSLGINSTLHTNTTLTNKAPEGFYKLNGSDSYFTVNSNGVVTSSDLCNDIPQFTSGALVDIFVNDINNTYATSSQITNFNWVTGSVTLEAWHLNDLIQGDYDTVINLNDQAAGGDRDFLEIRIQRTPTIINLFGNYFDGTTDIRTQPFGNDAREIWYHSVLTWDSSTGQMLYYRDGNLIGSASVPSITTELNNPYLNVGKSDNGTADPDMYIGEYRVYPFALNSTQIQTNYDSTKYRY